MSVGDVDMGATDIAFAVVGLGAGLGTMVFFVVVLVEMFKRQQTVIAIACIVLFLTTLMGPLVAFIFGWFRSKQWGLRRIMWAWTGCLAVCLITVGTWIGWMVVRAQSIERSLDPELLQAIEAEQLKIETQ